MKMEAYKINEEYIEKSIMLYARRTGPYGPENGVLMEKMKNWITDNGLMGPDTVILGIAWDNAAVVAPEKCRYDVCLVGNTMDNPVDKYVDNHVGNKVDSHVDKIVDKDVNNVDWIQKGEAPCGKYLVLELPHTAEAIGAFWQEGIPHIMGQGYELDHSRPIVERYKKRKVDQGLCEMMVPVR